MRARLLSGCGVLDRGVEGRGSEQRNGLIEREEFRGALRVEGLMPWVEWTIRRTRVNTPRPVLRRRRPL